MSDQQPEIPVQKQDPDWARVRDAATACIHSYNRDSDDAHYLYEEVLTALYGHEIFSILNKRLPRKI